MPWKQSVYKPNVWRRPAICVCALLPVFVAIHFVAYWLRFEGQMTAGVLENYWHTVAITVLVKFIAFGWFRVYQGWNKYATFHDLVVLGKAATASSILSALVDYMVFRGEMAPRSVLLMDWGATIVVVGGLRSIARLLEERGTRNLMARGRTPVLIVGANDAGETLLRAIRRERHQP